MNNHRDKETQRPVEDGEGIAPDPELADLAAELRRLWHALAHGPDHSKIDGLQRQQVWVLGALSHGPRRMTDLAECAQTSQASLTGIVDRLEEQGLVERLRLAVDRRVVEVALTDAGRDEMRRKHRRIMERLDEALTPLSAEERSELLRLVRLITQHDRDCAGC